MINDLFALSIEIKHSNIVFSYLVCLRYAFMHSESYIVNIKSKDFWDFFTKTLIELFFYIKNNALMQLNEKNWMKEGLMKVSAVAISVEYCLETGSLSS